MGMEQRIAARRLAFEARADALFETAWAGVQTLAQPFKIELDFLREPGGGWRDFLACAAYPALELPLLLLDELGLPDGPVRARVEDGLMDASALAAAAVLVSELVQGAEHHFNHEHGLLAQGLLVQAQWQLAAVARDPAAAAAWSVAHWNEHGSAMLDHRTRRLQRSEPYTPDEVAHLGRRWAPLKTPVFVAADRAGQPGLASPLDPLLDEAQSLYQLGRELGSLCRDLSRGHCSHAVWRLAQALGGPSDRAAPPDADRVLLAALLTPTLSELATEALTRTELLRGAMRRLGLTQVARALAGLAVPFEHVLAARTVTAGPPADGAQFAFSLSPRPQRDLVIEAARGYLQADPGAKEAWEGHRWGFLNQAELVCRVFPLGFVLEHRIAAGEDCGAAVDALVDRYAGNRFHYFDGASAQPPDVDTLGLMLRLAPHAADPARCAALLETPLAWMQANVGAEGDIPVFMAHGFTDDAPGSYIRVVGRRCAVVQAGLLLGLLAFDAERFHALLVQAGRHVLQWFARCGAGAVRYYDLPYGAGVLLGLADGLRHSRAAPLLIDEIDAAQQQALALLTGWRGLGRVTPQDAALLELASHHPGGAPLRSPAWAEMLIRTQRVDGSWDASPLYVVPGRGNLTGWHASRLATSALACHALAASPRPVPHPHGDSTDGRST